MGIKHFRKNYLDLDRETPTITVTDLVATNDGQDYVNLMRNRNNTSGWGTTGSTDAANTTLEIDLGQNQEVDSIFLVRHNLKAYTLKYWDGASWVNFSTPIAETVNSKTTTFHTFDAVTARQFQLIITGTMVADDDKFICQWILTEAFGEFSFQPEVAPVLDKSKKITKYLSGKRLITRSAQAFAARFKKSNVTSDVDFTLIELLHDSYEGFLVWLCGGEDSASVIPMQRAGWRREDIYLVNIGNEYEPGWSESRFKNGMDVDLAYYEVV